MAAYKSKNPALSTEVFTKAKRIDESLEVMTISRYLEKYSQIF